MMGVEVWTSREDLERYMTDDVAGIFERAGVVDLIPVNASFEIVPVDHAVGRFTDEGEPPSPVDLEPTRGGLRGPDADWLCQRFKKVVLDLRRGADARKRG